MNIGMTKAIATQAAKDEIAKVGTGVDNVARTGVNEVKSQLDENTQQLNDKAEIRDVVIKGNGTLSDFDEETRRLIQGLSPTQINAVLGIGNVKTINTNFFKTGKNLFNKNNVTLNKYVNSENGLIVDSSINCISEKIYNMLPNTKYCMKQVYNHIAFFNSDNTFVSGVRPIDGIFTTPLSFNYCIITTNIDKIDIQQLEKGDKTTDLEQYSESLLDNLITDITYDKLAFTKLKYGVNLFNKNTCIDGKYVNASNGTLLTSSTLSASDFISIPEGVTHLICQQGHQMSFYGVGDIYINGYDSRTTNGVLTVPSNATKIRTTFKTSDKDIYSINIGNVLLPYQQYQEPKVVIPIELIEKDESQNINNIKEKFEILLPNEIKIAKGRHVEIYNKHICLCGNDDNFHFKYICNIGMTMKRKLTINTNNIAIGDYPLTVEVYNNNFEKIIEKSTTIKVVNTNTTSRNVMLIGDSLTPRIWAKELKTLTNNALNFIGTRTFFEDGGDIILHEGRAGWTSGNYISDSSFSWFGNYKIKVASLTIQPISKKQYTIPLVGGSIGKFEVEEVKNENGLTWVYLNRLVDSPSGEVPQSGIATSVEQTTEGDVVLNYTEAIVTSFNPFWNKTSNKLDFNNYLSTNNIVKPNNVVIFLGANDMGLSGTVTTNNLKVLIDAINRDWNIPINLVLTIYYGNQNGLGKQSGNSRQDFDFRKKMFEKHKCIIDTLQGYTNVNIVPVGMMFDSEYNFGQVETNINPRNSNVKEYLPIEATHPDNNTRGQISDVLLGYV